MARDDFEDIYHCNRYRFEEVGIYIDHSKGPVILLNGVCHLDDDSKIVRIELEPDWNTPAQDVPKTHFLWHHIAPVCQRQIYEVLADNSDRMERTREYDANAAYEAA